MAIPSTMKIVHDGEEPFIGVVLPDQYAELIGAERAVAEQYWHYSVLSEEGKQAYDGQSIRFYRLLPDTTRSGVGSATTPGIYWVEGEAAEYPTQPRNLAGLRQMAEILIKYGAPRDMQVMPAHGDYKKISLGTLDGLVYGRKSAAHFAAEFLNPQNRRGLMNIKPGKNPNPMVQVSPLAVSAKKKFQDDIKAGHKDGAEYWAGAAGHAFLLSNPGTKHLGLFYDAASGRYTSYCLEYVKPGELTTDIKVVTCKKCLANKRKQEKAKGNPRSDSSYNKKYDGWRVTYREAEFCGDEASDFSCGKCGRCLHETVLYVGTPYGTICPQCFQEYKDRESNPNIEDLPAKDCVINSYFTDDLYPIVARLKYCKENCGFKCIKGKVYKKLPRNTIRLGSWKRNPSYDKRYKAYDGSLQTIAEGDLLRDVQALGVRLIIDWKKKRHGYQGKYPPTVMNWRDGIPTSSAEVLRRLGGKNPVVNDNPSKRHETQLIMIKYARQAAKGHWNWEDIAEEIRRKGLDYPYYESFFSYHNHNGLPIGYDWVNGNMRWRKLVSMANTKMSSKEILAQMSLMANPKQTNEGPQSISYYCSKCHKWHHSYKGGINTEHLAYAVTWEYTNPRWSDMTTPAVHWVIVSAKGEKAMCNLKGRHMPYWQGSRDVAKVTCKDCLRKLGARNPLSAGGSEGARAMVEGMEDARNYRGNRKAFQTYKGLYDEAYSQEYHRMRGQRWCRGMVKDCPCKKSANPIFESLGAALVTGLGVGSGYIISKKLLDPNSGKKKK